MAEWIGRISKYIVSAVKFHGKTVEDPKVRCPKCESAFNLNDEITEKGGKHLATLRHVMENTGRWNQKRRELEDLREKGRLDLYEFSLRRYRLRDEFERGDIGPMSALKEIAVVCPKCYIPLGHAEVTLKVLEPELATKELRWEELYGLGIPEKVLIRVAYNLGYPSAESLKRWVENPDLSKAEGLLREFEERFKELEIPDYLRHDFEGRLATLIDALPRDIRRRKQVVVEEVQKTAEADARVA